MRKLEKKRPPATYGRTQIIGCVFTAEGLRQIAEDIRFYRTNSNFGIRLPLGAPHFACTCMYMYVPRVDPYDRALVAGGLGRWPVAVPHVCIGPGTRAHPTQETRLLCKPALPSAQMRCFLRP